MKVDGKEFLRNVGLEQDKERLIQEQQKLEELKRASIEREQSYVNTPASEDESAFVDLSLGSDSHNKEDNSVDDIILDSGTENNKKKYIMLGIGLVLLFIITVLVIRLISNNDTQSQLDEMKSTDTKMVKDEILNKLDTNEAYQEVIDKNNTSNDTDQLPEIEETNIPTTVEKNVDAVDIDTPENDIFELEKQSAEVVEKVVQATPEKTPVKEVASVPQRKIVVPSAEETDLSQKAVAINGYFIQIGAFSKAPNKSLIDLIKQKGYSYKIYKLTIKGKLYNKVLIGSYNKRSDASKDLEQVKKDFNNPNAYILKF